MSLNDSPLKYKSMQSVIIFALALTYFIGSFTNLCLQVWHLNLCFFPLLLFLFLALPEKELKISEVCFEALALSESKGCFQVEVARTPEEHQQGLMFRNNLDQNRGMLFVFREESNYSFWMKNTFIPLDMIWINQNNEVVFIKENALPCPSLSEDSQEQAQINCPPIEPNQNAKYVLEVNGGTVKSINIKLGDKVSIN